MRRLRFAKGHGLGNDYLVVHEAELPDSLTGARAVLLCDRHRGPGSDGVLVADLAMRPKGPFRLRIVNPDGTEAEKSGNGLRIFAAWLHARGAVETGAWFDVELARDTVRMRVEGPDEGRSGALIVRVEMGRAAFSARAAGFTPAGAAGAPEGDGAEGAEDDVGGGVPLALPGGVETVHPLSLGNPHCVVLVDRLERDDFVGRAPALCTHEAFPAGTNVQWARAAGPRLLEAWIWERGAGETLASGSSACAVAAVAVRNGLVEAGAVEVRMPGGSVQVDVAQDYALTLVGPAVMIYEGELTEAMTAAWLAEGS
ncbi:MAG: diaminopimelate epimerase [Gemmatimonadota bacterium]